MKNTVLAVIVLVVVAGVVCGCKPPPPPPPEIVVDPGPQSKEEVLVELQPTIMPLRACVGPGRRGIQDYQRQMVIAGIRDAQVQYGHKRFAKEAFRELGYEITEIAKQASQEKRWYVVEACVDAHELLSMNSAVIKRLDARAKEFMKQPKVRVRGFVNDLELHEIHVFLELIDRRTGERESVRAREGEEFNDLRLLKIIGDNQIVRFEYIPVPGLFFDVKGIKEGQV